MVVHDTQARAMKSIIHPSPVKMSIPPNTPLWYNYKVVLYLSI